MINNNIAEKIKLYVSINDFLTDKRLITDTELDEYIINNYSDDCSIQVIKNDFITYKINEDHVFIKDFISFGNGIKLWENVLNKATKLKLPVRAMVHFSNHQLLNICMNRYKFEIIGATENQFIIERKV